MTVSDIPAAAELFLKIFRQTGKPASEDLRDYLHDLAFGSPSYSEAIGSFVHAYDDGRIGSILIAVPTQFVAHDRIFPARLLCAFMTDGETEAAGAARLGLQARARQQDLAFTDSASPTSRDHVVAVGGRVLQLQSLEWTRNLAPFGSIAANLERRLTRRIGLAHLARAFDALLRRLIPRLAPPPVATLQVSEMPRDAFIEAAPQLIAHYAVRPLWSRAELSWLLDIAARNTSLGPLNSRAVHDLTGRLVGAFLYYGASGRPASVLNVLALKGEEDRVVAAMMHDLDRAGCIAVVGRAQPALMNGLAQQRMVTFRHKAFACLLTRHADVTAAADRGDIYLGGLAGESWSRLMTDF